MKPLLSLLSIFILATSALAAPQSAAGEAKALSDFKKAFHPKKGGTVAERRQALNGVSGFASTKVTQALVKAHVDLEEQLGSIDSERTAAMLEIAKYQKGQEFKKHQTYPQAVIDKMKELRQGLKAKREFGDELRELHTEVRENIGAISDPESVRWLVKNVLASKKYTLLLKLTVSELAGNLGAEIVTDLQRVFSKARRPEEIVALLRGISFAGKDAKPLAPQLIKLLNHKDTIVRERAAMTLARVAVPEAIEPMIDLLERETGRSKDLVADALEILTRQQHGDLVTSWRRWFADEKDRLLAGDAPLGGGMFERKKKTVDTGYYFDIAMDGKSIMYIIDASGSMTAEIKSAPEKTKSEGAPPSKGMTRLRACKDELKSALLRLEPDAEFNVIWYNDIPRLFSEKMLSASKGNVGTGREYVDKLKPNGFTNIFDSMKMAFDMAGRGTKDKYYATGLDTIFLLTDGAPTKSDGKPDSTEKIIEAVREWNVLKRVKVHTIGIGEGINTAFLQQLASENDGEFRHYK